VPVVPNHAGTPYLPGDNPSDATRLLRYALPRQGFPHTDQSDGYGMSALAELAELNVWCEDGFLAWFEDGVVVRHPMDDPAGAADRIAARHRHREPSQEDHSPTDSVRESTA
jgi:hypothetical protein